MLRRCHGHGLIEGAIIQIFYPGLDEPIKEILNGTTGGIFLYKTLNQAFQLLEDKVLFEVDWSNKLQMKPTQKSIAFADRTNYVQSEGYQKQNSHNLYSRQSHHDSNDSEKSITELNNDGGMISKISKAVSVA
ncbi:hypothetical protein Tco_0697435 [Tanacetum coccineum]